MDDKAIALASLQASVDSARWAYWSMIGTWGAGIATFLAVCVSLYLGLMRPRIKIRCEITESVFLTQEFFTGDSKEHGISIKVTNHSVNPVKLEEISWSFKKEIIFYQPFYSDHSAKLPCKLDYGEQAMFWIDLSESPSWIEEIAKGVKSYGGKISDLRCLIRVTTGERFKFKPNRRLREKLAKEFHSFD